MTTRYYTYKKDAKKRQKPGQKIDFRKGKGYYLTPTSGPRPAPIPPSHGPNLPASMFSGRGLFTTSDTTTAFGYHADWSAIQMDAEGDHEVEHGFPGQVCWWFSRPQDGMDKIEEARHKLIPIILEIESLAALERVLAIGRGGMNIPHAVIANNVDTWPAEGKAELAAQGWDLILEWYWNNIPSYVSPNAANYPLFRNVCFGTFNSETVPGRRVSVAEYRDVWKGPFSIWDTEGATGVDRVAYNVP